MHELFWTINGSAYSLDSRVEISYNLTIKYKLNFYAVLITF